MVEEDGGKSTYILVSSSLSVPDFCLGGCVYTKADDTAPGTNYCFKNGESKTTCVGGSCAAGGDSKIEHWIEKFFEEKCSMQSNIYKKKCHYEQLLNFF